MTETTYCGNCGQDNPSTNKYCENCGNALGGPDASQERSPAPSKTEVIQLPPSPETHPKTEVLKTERAAPETIILPTSPTFSIRFDNGAMLELSGQDSYAVGRTDPAGNWFPAIDLTSHGGELGGVSRNHARFFYQDGAFFLEDLSRNGSFINDKRLEAPGKLSNGDRLKFGRVQCTFHTMTNPMLVE